MGKLHQLIDEGKWDDVLKYLTQGEKNQVLEEACEPYREDLPLLMACERRAPDEVIMAILEVYPQATEWKSRGANMALHVATHRNLSEAVIEALIRAYPEALDEVNKAKVTPRNIGHSDLQTYQALRRPTECWHQLMKEEALEEAEVTRLKRLHDQVDAAIAQIQVSDKDMDELTQRLKKVEEKLDGVESLQFEKNTAKIIEQLQATMKESLESTENRLTTIEDDIKAATAREFIAKAASRAHQSDILRMQKRSADVASLLLEQVNVVRGMVVEVHPGVEPTTA